MAKALTVKSIEALKADISRREIPDGGLPGLYLVVQPSGAMSWAVRYRFGGKTKKHTIGAYPRFGLADARKSAGIALRAVAEGRDPGDEKRLARSIQGAEQNQIETILDDFLTRHVDVKNKASSAKESRRIIEAEIKPKWKGRQVQSITRREIIGLLDDINDRGAPIMANRVLALLRKFFNWAIERDIITASPAVNVKAQGQETSRDRVLADDELRLVWKAAKAVGWPFGTMTQLLLLTGQRREEVAGASRTEFSLKVEQPLWTIPKERAKNGKEHHVPLAPAVVSIIDAMPVIDGKKKLLLTTTGETPISGFSKAKERLDAEMLSIAKKEAAERGDDPEAVTATPWRIHDLRRTAASGMASLSIPVHVVEAVLNHKSGSIKGVAATYNRYSYADEKRRALSAWANMVAGIIGDGTDTNVISIVRASQ